MKSRILGSLISIGLLALLFGFGMHHEQIVRHQMGRDAFLAAEGARFDRMYVNPPSVAAAILASIILLVIFIGLYELIAFGFSKVFKAIDDSPEA